MLGTKDLKDLFGENSPDRVIQKAQKLAARGRKDQALGVIKEAIARLGEVPDLRVEMATLSLSAGRPKEAAESLRALLKADPSQVSRVEDFIGWARAQFPDVDALWEPMAEGLIARRNYAAAVECLERINKKSLESALGGRLNNLNRFLERGAPVPRSALPTLYFAALAYEAMGDWQKAVDSYRKILAASAADFTVVDERLKGLMGRHYKLTAMRLAYADILESSGHRERAKEEYLRALEVDARSAPQVDRYVATLLEAAPNDPDLIWALAKVRLVEGRLPEAFELCGRLADQGSHLAEIEKLLEELSSTGKESVDTQLLLGRVSLAQGKVSRAVSAISSALGNDAGARGLDALQKVVDAFPSEPRPYQILADWHLREGRIDLCLETFRALRRVDPASGPFIATRLQAVVTADPSNAAARKLLEEVCVEVGDLQGAVPLMRRRLRAGPEQARDVLGRLRSMMVSSPGDEGLRLAAAEASVVAGEPAAAWEHVQELIDPGRPPGEELLRLLVLCAGASADLFRRVASFIGSRPPSWREQPEVVFALAEAAGRAGEFREAVERFRKAASVGPQAAAVCNAAIRSLGKDPTTIRSGEERAALAEALLDAGDAASATLALRGAGALPPASTARLVDKFGAALRADPRNLSLSTGLAEVCLASGQAARALEIARMGIAGREDAASAQLTMVYGDALARSGRAGEAARAYATAARRDPLLTREIIERLQRTIEADMGVETAHLALGRLLINEGRVAEGVARLATAASIKPDLGPVVLKDLERTARRHPDEPSIDFARSQILLEAGDTAGAADALSGRIGADPERAGEILTRLETIASRDPSCARAQLELGRAFLAKGWAARACACLVRAHELDKSLGPRIAGPLAQIRKDFPDEPEAHIARGALYEEEGKPVPAAEAYLRAASLGGPRGARALEGLRRLCAAGREIPAEIHLLRARACMTLGEVAEAVEASRSALDWGPGLVGEVRGELDRLVGAYPASAVARLGRAAALLRSQQLEAAAEDLGEALRLDPACSDSVVALAKRILERRPSLPQAARALGDALVLAGDTAGAARALDAALQAAEGATALDLILARRALALRTGDGAGGRELLARAEKAAPDRDAFLEMLHKEALASASCRRSGGPGAAGDTAIEEAIARGDYFRAAAMLSREGASALKVWVLERCGRPVEAAACLEEMLRDEGAARRYAALIDRVVSRELEGQAPTLMAETSLGFVEMVSGQGIAPRAERAGGAVQGGAR